MNVQGKKLPSRLRSFIPQPFCRNKHPGSLRIAVRVGLPATASVNRDAAGRGPIQDMILSKNPRLKNLLQNNLTNTNAKRPQGRFVFKYMLVAVVAPTHDVLIRRHGYLFDTKGVFPLSLDFPSSVTPTACHLPPREGLLCQVGNLTCGLVIGIL